MKEVTIQALAKILGLTAERVSEILFKKSDDGNLTDVVNEDALAQLESIHAEHIKSAGADALQAKFDEGHKAGKFEGLAKAEEDLRKQFAVEGKTIKDIAAAIAQKSAQDAGTEDKILTSPTYLSLKTSSEAALEAVKADLTAKMEALQAETARKERFNSQLPAIEAAMAEAGAVLPKNPTAAAMQKKIFLDLFATFDFEVKETGVYLKKPDGSLEKDIHGHPVMLPSFAKAKASEYFDIATQPGRESPGNDGGSPPPAKKWGEGGAPLPTNLDDFNKTYFDINDPVARTELTKAYEAQQRGG